MDDLELERRKRHKHTIMSNWDEIAQGLREGKSFNLEEFTPDDNRRKRINTDIVQTLENKRKL